MRNSTPVPHRNYLSALLNSAILASTTGFTGIAQAQEADEDRPPSSNEAAQLEEIVVYGVRGVLQNSIAEKRSQQVISDGLSANDIGELPALSIGEAIQTITGLSTHREKGGASEMSIRGLGSFLGATTFNGREATNGSGDRAVNFNQFPAELMSKIAIYKSQQANLIEGGVSGTIELGTLKPLEFGRRQIQIEGKANYNPYQKRIIDDDGLGWRGTASYIDQFESEALGEFGIALGFQRNDVQNPEETYATSTNWPACNAEVFSAAFCPQVSRAEGNAGTPFYLAPQGITFRQISEDDQRDAVFAATQWQPNSQLEMALDLQYSDRGFAEARDDFTLNETLAGHQNVEVDPAGFLRHVEGISTLSTVSALTERDEEYIGGGFKLDYKINDRLTLLTDFSYSYTERTQLQRASRFRSDALDIFGNPTPIANQRVPYIYDLAEGNFAPTITIDPRFDITDHSLFSDDLLQTRDERVAENEITAARLDVIYDLENAGIFTQLDVGLRLSRQTYEDSNDRVQYTQSDRAVDREANLACRTVFPQERYLDAASGNSIDRWATFDPLCLYEFYQGTEDPGGSEDRRAIGNRDVEENVLAGYFMASYSTYLGSIPVYGNAGLRIVNTKVDSHGLRSDLAVIDLGGGQIRLEETGEFEDVLIENDTTRFLPSINVILELQDDLLLRLAAYRAMSRPAPSALGAGRSIQLEDDASFDSVADAIEGITANGSPRLKPLMSANLDASLEYYLNRDSLLSTAVYYKRFTGGFVPVVIDESYNIGGEEVTIPVVQTQNDDKKSRIYGLELTLSNHFSWLPAPFDGLGAKFSYNYADSDFETHDIRLGDVFDPVSGEVESGIIPPANLSGYSEHVVSAQMYFQRGDFMLQGIYNYKSDYFADFVGGNRQLRYVRDNETFDIRASYRINRHVSLTFEALNLFDEPKVTDMPVKNSVRQYHYYGSKYFMGVRVRI